MEDIKNSISPNEDIVTNDDIKKDDNIKKDIDSKLIGTKVRLFIACV